MLCCTIAFQYALQHINYCSMHFGFDKDSYNFLLVCNHLRLLANWKEIWGCSIFCITCWHLCFHHIYPACDKINNCLQFLHIFPHGCMLWKHPLLFTIPLYIFCIFQIKNISSSSMHACYTWI